MKKGLYIFIALLLALVLAPSSADAYTFLRNLQQGSVGVDVLELQKVLNANVQTRVSQSGPGSPGSETTYFGPATKRAVILFQELYRSEVLAPVGLSSGSGYVGVLTRQKLNAISNNSQGLQVQQTSTSTTATTSTGMVVQTSGQSLASTVPVITSLSTSVLNNGETLVIYGKNFQPKNTILISIEVPGKFVDIPTASSTSIQLNFTSTISAGLKKQLTGFNSNVSGLIVDKIRAEMSKQSGSTGEWLYPAVVTVKNTNGTSNSFPIKINLLKGI